MITMCLIFEKKIIRVICVHVPQSGKPDIQKDKFYDKLVDKWHIKRTKEFTLGIGDFNSHVGKKVDRFAGIHEGNGIGEQNLEGGRLLKFCNQKDLSMANTWFKKEKRKATYNSGGNETEVDFVLVGKESRKFLKNAKVISWELHHKLVVVELLM